MVEINITTKNNYKLRILVGYHSSNYELYYPDGQKATGSEGLGITFNNTFRGSQNRGVEIALYFSRLPEEFVSQFSSGEHSLSIRLITPGGTSLDEANINNSDIKIIYLVVENWHIVNSYYIKGGERYPVPIPEPGLLVSAAIAVTTLGVVAYVTAGRRKS